MMRIESAGIRQHPQPRALERSSGCAPSDGAGAVERRPVRHDAHDGDDARPEASHLARQAPSAGAKFGGRELVGRSGRARDEIRDAAPESKQFAAVAGSSSRGVNPEAKSAGQKRFPGRAK